jgi:UPF0716 family protein affecting phage T7 exclusion
MLSVQVFIAIAVTVGVAVAVTIVLAVAGVIFQRDQGRAAKAHPVTIPAQRLAQTADTPTRELVLR